MSEQVNHPSHYNREGRKECIDEFVDIYGVKYTILWCIMTADKYVYRAGAKDGNSEEQDLQKARWYMQWAREHFEEDDKYSSAWLAARYYKAADKLLTAFQDYYDKHYQKGD